MSTKTQDFHHHTRMVPLFHYVTFGLVAVVIAGGLVHTFMDCSNNLIPGLSITLGGVALGLAAFFARAFALKAQDRAIRAEENFRHYLLTGKPLPQGLHPQQIVALRFASDEEFPALAEKALKEKLKNKAIKAAIKNWKADNYRV
jgi:hypothetical protein